MSKTKTKTGVGRLLQHIADFVTHLFHNSIAGAEADYNNLPPETQQALKHGAGVMTFISQEFDKEPAIIREGILDEFPDLDEQSLEKGLYEVAHALNLAPEASSIDDTIAKLKKHFESLKGGTWDNIVQASASIFAIITSPADEKIQAVANLVKYVYMAFFKK